MARRRATDASERRTEIFALKLAPTERAELETAAKEQGATLSAYVRERLFRRSAAVVAASRRNPEARELLREINAVGNNLNQIARSLNISGTLRDWGELRQALEWHKQTVSKVLDL
jgi:Bacterial mobilisation protein (MobC)